MNAFKLTLAAAALAFGSVSAYADAKAPPLNAVSSERSSVDQVGVGRLVESRARVDIASEQQKYSIFARESYASIHGH